MPKGIHTTLDCACIVCRQKRGEYVSPWNKGKKGVQVAWNKGMESEEFKKHYEPDFFSKRGKVIMTKMNKEHADMASKAGKRGGPRGRGKGCGKGIYRRTEKHLEVCRKGGLATVISGQLFKNSRKRYFIEHDSHFHRSRLELEKCKHLQKIYGKNRIHVNVHMRLIEIDFVITDDIKNVDSWEKVIEFHPYSFDGTDLESYESRRRKILNQLGVSCLLEVLQ